MSAGEMKGWIQLTSNPPGYTFPVPGEYQNWIIPAASVVSMTEHEIYLNKGKIVPMVYVEIFGGNGRLVTQTKEEIAALISHERDGG